MQLSFRFADGRSVGPLEFEHHVRIDDVASHLKAVVKPTESVYARLLWESSWLPPGQKLSETSLNDGDVLETLWASASPLPENGNDGAEVLPRRRANLLKCSEDSAGRLDVLDCSGMYKLDRDLDGFEQCITPSLQVLDIRQCAFKADFIRRIFAKVPATLKELRASRNIIRGSALECLCDRGLSLRVLDIGYSHCEDCSSLPRIGGIAEGSVEELVIGDLESLTEKPRLLADVLPLCPQLKLVDFAWNNQESFLSNTLQSLAQHCPLVEAVYGYRTEPEAPQLLELLSRCQNVTHLEVSGISSPEVISNMAQLPSLRSVRLELTSSEAELMKAMCRLKVETLYLEFGWVDDDDHDEDDIEFALDLCENPTELTEHFSSSSATNVSLVVAGVEPSILEAIGSRLHQLGPLRAHSADHPILEALVQAPSCCVNLVRLDINFYEQIDAGTLATVAERCPSLKIVMLNADENGFQKTPIDEGILALGRHCSKLEHLDLYDRLLQDPATTLATAVAGWPHLRYLCAANTTEMSWVDADPDCRIFRALAAHCPSLQNAVFYDMPADWTGILQGSCPLYGELDLDSDSE
ncbi:ANK1 [Symbiodinium sp. CCMP2592]|nr:ANK1 [Symbiodinium sp. CCMP2592]